jgi:ABC-2 type transport system ATP-binding protein
MDEAERCHRLAILDRGRLVANGSPRQLERGITAHVIRIECEVPHAVRSRLQQQAGILSVTQLGLGLRVLIEQRIDNPLAHIENGLSDLAGSCQIEHTHPNLEDVFVATTRLSGGNPSP